MDRPGHDRDGAVLGFGVPALGGRIPIEELVFNAAGFALLLLLYVWCDEYWVGAYNVPDYAAQSRKIGRLLGFDYRAVVVGVVLVLAASAYKKLLAGDRQGFPMYFTYLTAAAVIPAAGFCRSVERFINWRAFSITFFFLWTGLPLEAVVVWLAVTYTTVIVFEVVKSVRWVPAERHRG